MLYFVTYVHPTYLPTFRNECVNIAQGHAYSY